MPANLENNSGQRTGKCEISFHFQRKVMPKNVKTIVHLGLFHMLSKVMLKTLEARLQQYVNQKIPYVQVGFWRGRGARNQIDNIQWVMEKAREFQKNIYVCFIDSQKP